MGGWPQVLARRTLAAPLLVVGGVIFVATALADVAAGFYFEYVGLKMIFGNGQVGEGLLVAGAVPMVAAAALSIASVPGAALLALGQKLWGGQSSHAATRVEYWDSDLTDAELEPPPPEMTRPYQCAECG